MDEEEGPQPGTVGFPPEVYRVARASDPMRYSTVGPADAQSPRAGNRFDVPGGGVLYAASAVRTCFAETLSRFRPSPKLRALLADDPEEARFMGVGHVPRDWRLQRTILTVEADDPLPFLDVEAGATLEFLSEELASQLLALGYEDNLDVSDVRGRDRRLTRAIASWAYTAQTGGGNYRFSGVRYLSRLGTSQECWAIFEGTEAVESSRRNIEESDPHLLAVTHEWDLRVF